MNTTVQEAMERLRRSSERGADARPASDAGATPSAPLALLPVAVFACADPEVHPESVFDLPPEALFVVRTAGPVLDDAALGSLEYAVAERGVSVVVVLGHRDCRLVRAAVTRPTATGGLGIILDAIEPAVIRARHQGGVTGLVVGDAEVERLTDAAVTEHVRQLAADLRGSRIIHPYVDEGRVAVVGAVYDPAEGRVEWLEP